MPAKSKNRYYDGPISDHFDGERFFMPDNQIVNCTTDLLKWQFDGKKARWPRRLENPPSAPVVKRSDNGTARITFIGQASFLIQLQGLNILTDPLFSNRTSPISWLGPKRVRPPGLTLNDLPEIDVILLSHNHYDHMDIPALKKLHFRHRPLVITPLGNGAILRKHMRDIDVEERDWGERVDIGNRLAVSLAPARHWSKRTFYDRNHALWCAFCLHAPGMHIYFAGDTGYGGGDHFHWVRQEFGAPEIALLPIGAYEPRWFMHTMHMNPHEAVKAHLNLGAQISIGMHHETVQLTNEPIDAPVKDLQRAMSEFDIATDAFRVLDPGHAAEFPARA